MRDVPAAPALDSLRDATEAAARAAASRIAQGWLGEAGAAAVEAMRESLSRLPFSAVVAVGQGAKGEVASLYDGERFGAPGAFAFDLAVDAGEGTTYLTEGLTNAMAVAALAPRGAIRLPQPALYMEKFAAAPAARGEIDPSWPVDEKLAVLGKVLGKDVGDLTIFVLEKPRHRRLIDRIEEAGARVAAYPAGDLAGALLACLPGSDIDALMGTGGVREGMLSAAAARALGAEFAARLDPQLPSEQAAVREAGLDLDRWLRADELVTSGEIRFCATGIVTGRLLEGVERAHGCDRVQTFTLDGTTGERQRITRWRRCEPGL